MREESKEGMTIILIIIFIILSILAISKCHRNQLKNDGFTIIEKHETYCIVEKDGHQYIATETGMYNLDWQFEHYPNCPCMKSNK